MRAYKDNAPVVTSDEGVHNHFKETAMQLCHGDGNLQGGCVDPPGHRAGGGMVELIPLAGCTVVPRMEPCSLGRSHTAPKPSAKRLCGNSARSDGAPR